MAALGFIRFLSDSSGTFIDASFSLCRKTAKRLVVYH